MFSLVISSNSLMVRTLDALDKYSTVELLKKITC